MPARFCWRCSTFTCRESYTGEGVEQAPCPPRHVRLHPARQRAPSTAPGPLRQCRLPFLPLLPNLHSAAKLRPVPPNQSNLQRPQA